MIVKKKLINKEKFIIEFNLKRIITYSKCVIVFFLM